MELNKFLYIELKKIVSNYSPYKVSLIIFRYISTNTEYLLFNALHYKICSALLNKILYV